MSERNHINRDSVTPKPDVVLRGQQPDPAAELAALRERVRVRELALQSLTPGGSEYVNDPERCVAYVKDAIEQKHRIAAQAVKRARAAEEQVRVQGEQIGALRDALKPFAELLALSKEQDESIESIIANYWYRPEDDIERAVVALAATEPTP